MQAILSDATSGESRKARLQCPNSYPSLKQTARDRYPFLKRLWESLVGHVENPLPPLHPTAQLIQSEMRALPPFNNMTLEKLSELAVAVSVPSWLTDSSAACHVVTAASNTFGRFIGLESPPSSSYTAAGYELCRISHDAFDCTGPGRIMTLEYNGKIAVASVVQTPLRNWFTSSVTVSTHTTLTLSSMTEWINSFIGNQHPDHLMLVGSRVNESLFANAVADSHAGRYLNRTQPSILPPEHVLALGAALIAKIGLESQRDDCGEREECIRLRQKADAIAGAYKPLRPIVWPANSPGHVEL